MSRNPEFNKKIARKQRCDMQDYSNQRYVGHLLDEGYFDTLIDHTSILHSDGLDAPDFIPCGAMRNSGPFYDRVTYERGISLQEQMAIDAVLDEILNEIEAE